MKNKAHLANCREPLTLAQIYRLEELHHNFSNGEYEEMNTLYSDEFQDFLYIPSSGKAEMHNAEQIRKGNKDPGPITSRVLLQTFLL